MLIKKITNISFYKNLCMPDYTNLFFLRKSRSFVKSRFSRSRQWSKSIVYFGLWFNLLSVFWSFLFCYKYAFIFNYFFWVFALFLLLISLKHAFSSNFSLLKGW